MNPNKALWEKGDFTQIAAGMRESGDIFIDSLNVKPGMRVLDLGCGDGTTALPLARRGAEVLGVDIAENLVAAGNQRAQNEGIANIKFQVGDACSLDGIPDNAFDLSVTVFGAMFAPKPFEVAKELVRVTKPGGRIVMGNWIPGDPTLVAQMFKITASFLPPPPEGFVSPILWGIESNVIERFGAAGIVEEQIKCERNGFRFDFPGSPADTLNIFRNFFGPVMNAFEAAEKDGRTADLERELVELYSQHNESGNSNHTTTISTFLRVTVTC